MMPSPKTSRDTAPPALRDRDFNRYAAAGLREVAAPVSFRFRDWNPDIRTAIRLGVEITYSSRTNEVACPQLGLSSRDINPRAQIMGGGGGGGFSPSGGSPGSSGNPSASGSASHSAGQSHSSGSSGSPKHKD